MQVRCVFFIYLFLKWGIYNTYDPKKDERTDGRMVDGQPANILPAVAVVEVFLSSSLS